MRILVYPHELAIGGSQINAIDLAAGVAAAGHDVLIYGKPGPLEAYIKQKGLRFFAANRLKYRPAPTRIAQLAMLARSERLDLIHAYEWPPCLDAYYGAHLFGRVPMVATVLGMTVMPYVPASVPLIMGTDDLGEAARRSQSGNVWVLEPPIDTANDHPGIDGKSFRDRYGVRPEQQLVVTVSRLALDLKLDALVRAIDAVDALSQRAHVRLIVVGGGEAHAALSARAAQVNQRRGRDVVTLAGPQSDPRAAYAAADVVIGMGSSALRALSIGRALVVQGEGGFSEIFSPQTLPIFLRQGFYGIGEDPQGVDELARQLDALIYDGQLRRTLGEFGRNVVLERFSLERAIGIQLQIYERVRSCPARFQIIDGLRSAYRALKLELHNHDPRQKRLRRNYEGRLLSAAANGAWPPLGSW